LTRSWLQSAGWRLLMWLLWRSHSLPCSVNKSYWTLFVSLMSNCILWYIFYTTVAWCDSFVADLTSHGVMCMMVFSFSRCVCHQDMFVVSAIFYMIVTWQWYHLNRASVYYYCRKWMTVAYTAVTWPAAYESNLCCSLLQCISRSLDFTFTYQHSGNVLMSDDSQCHLWGHTSFIVIINNICKKNVAHILHIFKVSSSPIYLQHVKWRYIVYLGC